MTNEEALDLAAKALVMGIEMRTAQAAYFKNRGDTNKLIAAKNAEKAFDVAAGQLLMRCPHLFPAPAKE